MRRYVAVDVVTKPNRHLCKTKDPAGWDVDAVVTCHASFASLQCLKSQLGQHYADIVRVSVKKKQSRRSDGPSLRH